MDPTGHDQSFLKCLLYELGDSPSSAVVLVVVAGIAVAGLVLLLRALRGRQ